MLVGVRKRIFAAWNAFGEIKPRGFAYFVKSVLNPNEGNMLAYVKNHISAMEADTDLGSRDRIFQRLGALGLDDFGEFLLSLPNPEFPRLSGILPRMASDQVQLDWTGNSGLPLLKQTLNFVRSMSYSYTRITGRSLDDARILDYGCGYGRIARLMYAFVGEAGLYGVDPWERSIEICHEDGFGENFRQSDYLPMSLPVDDRTFNLIYAFSVFTHLSERATLTALAALRKVIARDGLLVITIRPEEYWAHDVHAQGPEKDALVKTHRDKGFAFRPHNRAAVDGDVTYGDTSFTLEWLKQAAPDWEIKATDRSLQDPLQRYIYLTPREAS
ncbi:class I SAM-dependent methyltransferase [Dyella terrae]|uniref:class I SAM-dependent methyltransferase n=1 Tax=Dyella terrae TaxID=522259 RepID=UPI001EFC6F92|nr:class I SAM-dependent methyltransferase [Dyella terrae]ULU25206.1 class I SAM-dependent methyltransferase [Dyella terrae]